MILEIIECSKSTILGRISSNKGVIRGREWKIVHKIIFPHLQEVKKSANSSLKQSLDMFTAEWRSFIFK